MTESWLDRAADDLAVQLGGRVPAATILRYVEEAAAHLKAVSAVDTFIPVLATRMARERAEALGQAEGLIEKHVPEVLFVCVHNAGRSQMAAVLTKAMSGGRVSVRSAGSTPAREINAMVVEAMAEEGLDLAQEFPKPLTDEAVRAADVVITMGCGDACPVYPGKRYLDWQIPDPAGQPLDVVRWIREDVRTHVAGLLGDLGVEVVATESSRA
ncbi:MAG: arsenate reductase ArsC [Dehalococcoidia bacterium]